VERVFDPIRGQWVFRVESPAAVGLSLASHIARFGGIDVEALAGVRELQNRGRNLLIAAVLARETDQRIRSVTQSI
jgi:hypothetical protein